MSKVYHTVADLPEKVQKQVQERVASYPQEWTHGICAFDMFDKKEGAKRGMRNSVKGDVCHAALSYYSQRQEPVVVVNAHQPHWAQTSADFMRWVAKESPFSHGILNRDNEDEIFNHAGVLDTEEIGIGGALWICKAVRHFKEDDFKIKYWEKLRAEGLDGLQAFIGADILTLEGKPSYSNTHVSLYCYKDPKTLRKFYDEVRKAKKYEDKEANRGGYDYRFGIEADAKDWGSMAGRMEKRADGWGGYTEVLVPGPPADYAAKLKEIFTGDPKNVK